MGIETRNLLITNQLLCQLSYASTGTRTYNRKTQSVKLCPVFRLQVDEASLPTYSTGW